ncbi:hypothetical protein CDL15_Pgr019899 [Punica granatum]|uniref:Uncharacterized protein n=1 Tax=Punica granatum TaxID=22663 RepID=A0A218W4K1_PUNGR|nr:hypothetical protein CDL15_Pgr019899 [Punica granatum]
MSRAISRALSCCCRGVQGREPPPAAPSPPFSATPTAFQLMSLDPILASQVQPKSSAQRLSRAVSPSGRPVRSDPTRLFGDFFYFTEKPLNFPD